MCLSYSGHMKAEFEGGASFVWKRRFEMVIGGSKIVWSELETNNFNKKERGTNLETKLLKVRGTCQGRNSFTLPYQTPFRSISKRVRPSLQGQNSLILAHRSPFWDRHFRTCFRTCVISTWTSIWIQYKEKPKLLHFTHTWWSKLFYLGTPNLETWAQALIYIYIYIYTCVCVCSPSVQVQAGGFNLHCPSYVLWSWNHRWLTFAMAGVETWHHEKLQLAQSSQAKTTTAVQAAVLYCPSPQLSAAAPTWDSTVASQLVY